MTISIDSKIYKAEAAYDQAIIDQQRLAREITEKVDSLRAAVDNQITHYASINSLVDTIALLSAHIASNQATTSGGMSGSSNLIQSVTREVCANRLRQFSTRLRGGAA